MKRLDIVLKKLSELSQAGGVTAGELADALGLSRANVSSDLNQLCKQGRAEKSGAKPVYYRTTAVAEKDAGSLMDLFVRDNRSLFHCVEQAKAAVLYPPHGMHMLLLGETGVGKSMFAELIYRYACEKAYIGSEAPFVVFNCADYANNPQLLLSQLMGSKKGAYTGAEVDRPGLLEKADGGILFLDEVHCLPPEGQEMLFTYIDRQVYRRLGETELERRATVLLVCATTENPDSSLLKTFVRRIPMIIRIPNLSERSIDERLNLIGTFFLNESSRLGRPVMASVNSIRSLLSYHCPNNVGQLKNDIQIICAKAYSDFVSGRKQDVSIVSYDLPADIRQGLYQETSHRQIWNRFGGMNARFCVFDASTARSPFREGGEEETIYDCIDRHMQELRESGADDEQITQSIDKEIRSYFEKFGEAIGHAQNRTGIGNLVGEEILRLVDLVVEQAQTRLGRVFDENIRMGLAVHVNNAINRLRRGKPIVNPQLNRIRKENPEEFSAALESLKMISAKVDIVMPIDEAGFLAVFFCMDHLQPFAGEGNVQVVVIAHGASTATSMVSTANQLLGLHYADGIDAALDEKPQAVYARLKALLAGRKKADTLLLVDMGSFMDFASALAGELDIRVKTIPLVSTLHVVEAARKASLGYPLDFVYHETIRVNELLSETNPGEQTKRQLATMFILTACMSGDGSARLLKEQLDARLNYYGGLCETVALNLSDCDIAARITKIGKIRKIICIISALPLKVQESFFSLVDVMNGNALQQIQKLIDQEVMFYNIGRTLAKMLTYISGQSVFEDIRKAIGAIEQGVGARLLPDVLVGVFCHIGCMVDRVKGNGQVAAFPEKEQFLRDNSITVRTARQCCAPLEQKYGIAIPDDELCYIASYFNAGNCRVPED